MADLQAAKRYAQAAFAIASEHGTVAAWRSEMADIAAVLTDSGLATTLANARLPIERRTAMLERVLDVSPLALNLAKLLVSKGRAADARAVADAFGRLADGAEGIEHAQIVTAIELGPEQVADIERSLSASLGKRVRAQSSVDPAVLGGVIVRVGDRLLDGSVRTRLRQLRRQLQGAG